jgi:cytochrome c oxidase subunit III
MKRRVLDVTQLDSHAFGPRDPTWWGMLMLAAIEGTMLVLFAVSYLYVRYRTDPFPPTHMTTTAAWVMTAEVVLWIASLVVQHMTSQAAVKGNLHQMRRRLIIATLLATWACVLRIWVFALLPFRWDDHAFGSMVWGILAVQWLHGVTSAIEDMIYVVILFKGPVEDKHRVDIDVTSVLVDFTAAGAIFVWALIFVPLLLGGGR